ncbi:TfoX/Sxy family protein [Candidatus Borrarchaeum sp.]|uniref:TfoX/Sxy family protein n=1 Tax=Candidatus Borrarchaeum sp. TaxID=2846742 RepID=UPI00257D65D5|nr:TfoX/Sxy family protein [Candidatus Borrarchaeum sp.]
MKYYSEDEMKDLRLAFEEKVLKWKQIDIKKMFGCPCYQSNGKLFVFLVTKGIVITKLDKKEKEILSQQFSTTPFKAGKKTVHNWARIPINRKKDLDQIMPFVRKSYDRAIQET